MGVVGVAWATFIAQGISVVLSFLVFMMQLRKLKIGKTALFDISELVTMAKIAFPSILQSVYCFNRSYACTVISK